MMPNLKKEFDILSILTQTQQKPEIKRRRAAQKHKAGNNLLTPSAMLS